MLPADPQAAEVVLGPDGVLAHARPGTLLIDLHHKDMGIVADAARAVLHGSAREPFDAAQQGGVVQRAVAVGAGGGHRLGGEGAERAGRRIFEHLQANTPDMRPIQRTADATFWPLTVARVGFGGGAAGRSAPQSAARAEPLRVGRGIRCGRVWLPFRAAVIGPHAFGLAPWDPIEAALRPQGQEQTDKG
jgi:hypothetical protein